MIVNFRAREISRDIHKLVRTPTLIIKKKNTGHKDLNGWYSLINDVILVIVSRRVFLRECNG
jgi:hypothetical protein